MKFPRIALRDAWLALALCLGLALAFLVSGCAAYQATVSSREDDISGYDKDGNYGVQYTHKVYYR